jgi:hypothetical protein
VSERVVRLAVGGVVTQVTAVDGRESALAALAAGLRELPRGTRVRVAVSGAICRPFVLPDVDGATGEGDWTAIAASMVEDATGLPADSRVWLDAGQASPRLAVAIDAAWLRGLEALGARIESVRPWWALAIEAVSMDAGAGVANGPGKAFRPGRLWRRGAGPADQAGQEGGGNRPRGLVATDGDALVLLIAEGEVYRVAQTYAFDGESAATVLSRVRVTHDLGMDEVAWMRVDERVLPGHTLNSRLAFGEEAQA